MPKIRFTIRQLLLLVAAVAGALGLLVWCEVRRARFQRISAYHESRIYVKVVGGVGLGYLNRTQQAVPYSEISSTRQQWHREMKEKYRLAAINFWLPLDPDPAPPQE